jgi:hypothetical protein
MDAITNLRNQAEADRQQASEKLRLELLWGDQAQLLEPGAVGQGGTKRGEVAIAAQSVKACDDPHLDLRVA